MPLFNHFLNDIFQNYLIGELEKVYLGDDEPCDIVRKDDEMVNLSNGSMLKLKNIKQYGS